MASTKANRTVEQQAEPGSSLDVEDRLTAIRDTYTRPTAGGVCVVDGWGCKIRVERGSLEVHDGVGANRRMRRFDRATHGLSRLIVGNVTGAVSFDALRWLHAVGIGVVVLGPDDALLLASAPRETDDARLRRQQAVAPELPVGLDLAKWIMVEKVTGHAQVIATRFSDEETASLLLGIASEIESVASIDEVRGAEATAASIYWQAWSGRTETAPRLAAKDRRRVPAKWAAPFETRRSLLKSANGNRKASTPTNAAMNYAFALLEAEAVMACRVVGLDPGMGLVHMDSRKRRSMALDLMEPVRPEVEAFVLDLLASRTFQKRTFAELQDGTCRLMPPFSHELAETLPRWAELVAPVAEKVAHSLGEQMGGKYEAHTPLTRRRGHQAQTIVNARKVAARQTARGASQHQRPTARSAPPIWTCPDCGGAVLDRRRIRCDRCIDADPRQRPELRASRGRAISSRKRALRERDNAGLPESCDREWYRREVLPRLTSIKLAEIMQAADCSKGFASVVRSGKSLPHVSTWPALAALTGVALAD